MAREELRTVLGTPAGTETRFHPTGINVATRDHDARAWPLGDSDQPTRRRFRDVIGRGDCFGLVDLLAVTSNETESVDRLFSVCNFSSKMPRERFDESRRATGTIRDGRVPEGRFDPIELLALTLNETESMSVVPCP